MTAHPDYFKLAQQLAQRGKYQDMRAVLQLGIAHATNPYVAQHQAATLFLQQGFLSEAAQYAQQLLALNPQDLGARLHLAQIAHDTGHHQLAQIHYTALEADFPDNPIIQRNALTILEYDPNASDSLRYNKALNWGREQKRVPEIRDLVTPHTRENRRPGPLRLGYVSADFCAHTVGRLVKDVITQHRTDLFNTFTYSAGKVNDPITHHIIANTQFRDVSNLSDAQLAERIRADEIDILIDLSGHTAGSRLSAFALRPAPIQISWLGYFATTGLSAIDAVLLDDLHAPQGTEHFFCERIVRLPFRFCFTPPEFAPEVSTPPSIKNGYTTFGSFNNTAKFNQNVVSLWAHILNHVPNSRLILKWRTFNDAAVCKQISSQFATHGINPERLELRPPSSHKDMLIQYADIDIALDPFPFCGGMTSFEALWMGVPVITHPGTRVVSRQTHAILSRIEHIEWSAATADAYCKIAISLSNNPPTLLKLRHELRNDILKSGITDSSAFTQQLEHAYQSLIATD